MILKEAQKTMFKIGDKVYDYSYEEDHTLVHTITDMYYDKGYDIPIVELDGEYTVSAECIALAR